MVTKGVGMRAMWRLGDDGVRRVKPGSTIGK
jgi:hypothetical protein